MSCSIYSEVGKALGNFEYSGDQTDVNLRPLHYCDKGAIEQYVEWFNKNCDFNISKYSSNRIKSNGAGGIRAKSTKVSSTIVGGMLADLREFRLIVCEIQGVFSGCWRIFGRCLAHFWQFLG